MIVEALAFLVLPIVAFLAGAAWMQHRSGAPRRAHPLNLRFAGYDAPAVAEYWRGAALDAERRLLRLDLGFPLYYGAIALAAFAYALPRLGLDAWCGGIAALVAVVMIADWIENTIQIGQLDRYAKNEALQPERVRIAGVATQIKLAGSLVIALLNLSLGVWMLVRAIGIV